MRKIILASRLVEMPLWHNAEAISPREITADEALTLLRERRFESIVTEVRAMNALQVVIGKNVDLRGEKDPLPRMATSDILVVGEYTGGPVYGELPKDGKMRWSLIEYVQPQPAEQSASHLDNLPSSLGLGGAWDRDGGRGDW